MDQKTRQRLIEIADGVIVEEDVLRIVDKIREYDENLRIKYCPNPQNIWDAPYRLTEMCPDGAERVVFDIWQLDDRVLERLYNADTRKFDINGNLDATNEKARRDQERRYEDQLAEAKEISVAVAGSSKDTYIVDDPTTGKRITFKASAPAKVDKLT